MKNINYIINGVLAVAVVILFVMQFSGKKETSVSSPAVSAGEGAIAGKLPIAYVNVDSLLENYNYAKDLNEIILKKAENSRASVNQKAASLQKEMEELQDLDTRLSQELMSEQQKLNEQLRDSIVSQLRIFNKDKGFQVVLSNTGGDNVLLADDVYDITAALLEYLNKNYATK